MTLGSLGPCVARVGKWVRTQTELHPLGEFIGSNLEHCLVVTLGPWAATKGGECKAYTRWRVIVP